MKIAEGRYSIGRNLYTPKAVAQALDLEFGDDVEFHTDGERVYIVKKEASA